MTITIGELLDRLFETGASDLILSANTPPILRIDGVLSPVDETPIAPDEIERMVATLLSPGQQKTFDQEQSVDFSTQWRTLGRVRGNAYQQRGTVALSLRAIAHEIPTFERLGLPDVCDRLVQLPHGLILVTGPTGSGKSTTQASMLSAINRTRRTHIICIEDPIEYIHENALSVVEQREVGVDTPSFGSALRSSLREDPDVVFVGEMRDLESISMAVTIAETGHLVFATLHANDATQAVNRIIDVFPSDQQQQIRVQLSQSLAAVIHQELLPRREGGRCGAFEILVANAAVRNLIREGKTSQLRNVIATSAREGMQTLEASLSTLVLQQAVEHGEAVKRSAYPKEVQPLASGVPAPGARAAS